MKVLQHTRNERNLFFKPDRPDRNYRDRLLNSSFFVILSFLFSPNFPRVVYFISYLLVILTSHLFAILSLCLLVILSFPLLVILSSRLFVILISSLFVIPNSPLFLLFEVLIAHISFFSSLYPILSSCLFRIFSSCM